MAGINNFITDLLDEMLSVGGIKLFFVSGSKPSMMVNRTFRAVPGSEPVQGDELLFDLIALGIVIPVDIGNTTGRIDWNYVQEDSGTITEFVVDYAYTAENIVLRMDRKVTPWSP